MQEPLDRQAISLRWYYSVETLTSACRIGHGRWESNPLSARFGDEAPIRWLTQSGDD